MKKIGQISAMQYEVKFAREIEGHFLLNEHGDL